MPGLYLIVQCHGCQLGSNEKCSCSLAMDTFAVIDFFFFHFFGACSSVEVAQTMIELDLYGSSTHYLVIALL